MPFKNTEYRRQYERNRQKKVRDAKRERGECMRCKTPADNGRVYCLVHAAYADEQVKKSQNKDVDRYKHWMKTGRIKLRREVIEHYGGRCACCGELRDAFLTMDHINGDGVLHEKPFQKAGLSLYRWLRKNHFPKGFRVLCANCNHAMAIYGQCPHGTLPPQMTNHPANPYRSEWRLLHQAS